MKYYPRMVKPLLVAALLLGACSGSGSGPDNTQSLLGRLFINELEPSNQDTVTDEYGEPDDWIEIWNAGDTPVDMLGLVFADSSGTSQVLRGSILVPAGSWNPSIRRIGRTREKAGQ